MDRRTFIKLISSGAIGAYALDPEKLLWIPGAKTIIIPPERRLVYAAEIPLSQMGEWGCATRSLEEFGKYFYDVVEGPIYLNEVTWYEGEKYARKVSTEYQHIEVYEGIKYGKLAYEPE